MLNMVFYKVYEKYKVSSKSYYKFRFIMKSKITTYLRYGDLKEICELTNLSSYHINSGFYKGDRYIVNIIEELVKESMGILTKF